MPEVTGFDITRAAEPYSAVAGIIAGFAFAVLVWLVERLDPFDEDTHADTLTVRALVFLGITFLGSTLVAFFWALISGETNLDSNRPGILSYIAGWYFSLIAPLTIEAMVFVVASARAPRITGFFRRIFFAALIVSLSFQWASTLGLMATQTRAPDVIGANAGFVLSLLAASAALILGANWIRFKSTTGGIRLDVEASFSQFVWLWLAIILVGAVAFGVISISQSPLVLPELVIGIANLAWAFLMSWASLFLPGETDSRP
jgi:hypothetical protein